MIFVLVNPTVPFLSINHEFVIPEPRIDKCVNEGAG
jgi:hypothetical protein